MHEAGMFRMFLPREVGGPELDPWTAFEVTEQLAMADASVAWCAQILSLSAWAAASLPQRVAAEVFANPEDVVAGSIQGQPTCEVVESGLRLSGRFNFASGCLHSTWIYATIPDPRHEGEGPPPIIAALLPISECTIHDVWHTTGLRGTSSNDWSVGNVFIPWERTFQWAPRLRDPFAKGSLFRHGILAIPGTTHAGVALGTARAAIQAYLDRVEERKRRGVSLKNDPVVQNAIGKADALVSSARSYLKEAVDDLWCTLTDGDEPSLEQRGRLRAAKSLAVWNSVDAVHLVYEAMGAQAILEENPVERPFRDIHAVAAHVASMKAGYTLFGAVLMGIDPRPALL
jgi:alkylation response protein AidB-like acyl-CoA dehydrogenase